MLLYISGVAPCLTLSPTLFHSLFHFPFSSFFFFFFSLLHTLERGSLPKRKLFQRFRVRPFVYLRLPSFPFSFDAFFLSSFPLIFFTNTLLRARGFFFYCFSSFSFLFFIFTSVANKNRKTLPTIRLVICLSFYI